MIIYMNIYIIISIYEAFSASYSARNPDKSYYLATTNSSAATMASSVSTNY